MIKPFSMAFLGWLFFKHIFIGFIGPIMANEFLAGTIILATAPCTAIILYGAILRMGIPHIHWFKLP
jgi:ACR3 family arsenite transporter